MPNIPQHIAIILDGNGRWAKKRFLPRVAGHIKGIQAVKKTVKACVKFNIKYLTLFAFSSENWKRPPEEVSFLMHLLYRTLNKESENLKNQGVYLNIIGDLSNLPISVKSIIQASLNNQPKSENIKLYLNVAINYGGRWDIVQAFSLWLNQQKSLHNNLQTLLAPTSKELQNYLSLANYPEPDLMIRTGGEQRISNFLLWQMAYTELYFTSEFWPEFNENSLLKAIESYNNRERRFGKTSEQILSNL